MVTFFDQMDSRLNNIGKLKNDYFDESYILIYVYLDYLINFTNKRYSGKGEHRKNFRYFIMNYSDLSSELKCLQIDKFYYDYWNNEEIRTKYNHYYERIEDKLNEVESGVEIPLHSFITLDDIREEDKEYFLRYTIANKIYDYRNDAIHEYRNTIIDGCELAIPFLSFTENLSENQEGWFVIEIPFIFMWKLLINCYTKVRIEYGEFVKDHFLEG